MSIFANNSFLLSVKYAYRQDAFGNVSGVRVLPDDADGDDVQELFCRVARDDANTMYRIEEEATVINHVTGAPMIRKAILVPAVLDAYFLDWKMLEQTEDGEEPRPVPFSKDALQKLPSNLRTALALRWLQLSY